MPAYEKLTFAQKSFADPVTGRTWKRLTSGADTCHHLYFYGDCASADGRQILFHRYSNGGVQNWKVDILTGEAVRLTDARTKNCLWRPWTYAQPATGVRELLSMFSPELNTLFYFNGNTIRAVEIDSFEDREVFELPADRIPCGMGSASPDGRHLVIPHVDLQQWQQLTAKGTPERHLFQGVRLEIIETDSGDSRPMLEINSWITHAEFLDKNRVIFCYPATDHALLMADLCGQYYVALRPQTMDGLRINHHHATAQGIIYETVSPNPRGVIGRIDPDSFAYEEYFTDHPISHTGRDPEGRLWFVHSYREKPRVEHFLGWIPKVVKGMDNPVLPLTAGFQLLGKGQKSHPHPTLLPGRNHILFAGPDSDSGTMQLHLLDVSDLANVETQIASEQ